MLRESPTRQSKRAVAPAWLLSAFLVACSALPKGATDAGPTDAGGDADAGLCRVGGVFPGAAGACVDESSSTSSPCDPGCTCLRAGSPTPLITCDCATHAGDPCVRTNCGAVSCTDGCACANAAQGSCNCP